LLANYVTVVEEQDRPIMSVNMSPSSSLPLLAVINPPCSTVSLRQLSYLFTIKTTHQELSYCRDSVRRRSLRRWRSFKVTNFYTNLKPVCDFISVKMLSYSYTLSHAILACI